MANSFSRIEITIKRKGRRRFVWNFLLALMLAALAFFLYRRYA